jgi:hypothetical protein
LSCNDQFDNDFNGLIDCDDPACAEIVPCGAPAPTLSAPWTMMLAVILGLIGLISLLHALPKPNKA